MNIIKNPPLKLIPETNNTNTSLTFIRERALSLSFIPTDVSIKCYDFQLDKYHKNLFYELGIHVPESINNSVAKRQAEFLAGRYCALSALNGLGINCSNIAIGKHRCPIWPDNTIASISHSSTTSVCVASYKDNYRFLGVDIESLLSTESISQIKRSIITLDEEAILGEHSLSFSEAFTLAFSAKESLFKALYPRVGYYFDFSAANITKINTTDKSFILVLTEDLSDELTIGTKFIGFFEKLDRQVLTFIAG